MYLLFLLRQILLMSADFTWHFWSRIAMICGLLYFHHSVPVRVTWMVREISGWFTKHSDGTLMCLISPAGAFRAMPLAVVLRCSHTFVGGRADAPAVAEEVSEGRGDGLRLMSGGMAELRSRIPVPWWVSR